MEPTAPKPSEIAYWWRRCEDADAEIVRLRARVEEFEREKYAAKLEGYGEAADFCDHEADELGDCPEGRALRTIAKCIRELDEVPFNGPTPKEPKCDD